MHAGSFHGNGIICRIALMPASDPVPGYCEMHGCRVYPINYSYTLASFNILIWCNVYPVRTTLVGCGVETVEVVCS